MAETYLPLTALDEFPELAEAMPAVRDSLLAIKRHDELERETLEAFRMTRRGLTQAHRDARNIYNGVRGNLIRSDPDLDGEDVPDYNDLLEAFQE